MIAFNVGVELGQLVALSLMLILIVWWRTWPNFQKHALVANTALMVAGFALTQYQLIGYIIEQRSLA
jgi:hypothetical protein